jgi:dimethylglycine dehydrogenase
MMRFFHSDGRSFVGREATLENTAKWKLVYGEIDSDVECRGGEPVLAGDRVVGLTTSGDYGHRVGKSLMFAYLHADAPAAGLSVQILNEAKPLRLLDQPAYDADSLRARM